MVTGTLVWNFLRQRVYLLFFYRDEISEYFVKAGDKLQVKMEEDAEGMNEVVVTGYGVAKKERGRNVQYKNAGSFCYNQSTKCPA